MERITSFRAGVMLLVVALVLSFFSFKLYAMQVIDQEENSNNLTTYITRTRVRAARGAILDTNGNRLVGNRASYDLVFKHYVILTSDNANQSLLDLVRRCQSLGIEYNDHLPITKEKPFTYTLGDYNAAWQGYFQKFLVNRGDLDSDMTAPMLIKALRVSYEIPEDWSDEEARLVLGLRYELTLRNSVTNLPNFVFLEDATEAELSAILELGTPGLGVESSTVREYYTEYAAHVLGYIGEMDKDQLAYYTELGYPMDALVGQSGFEEAFEEYLHGTDGIRIDEFTKDGTIVKSYYEVEPKAGNNVEVSIDLLMQMAAEDKLAEVIEALRAQEVGAVGQEAQGGAVVALDVKTGQVLVSASYPTYDLANLRQDYNEILGAEFAPLVNRVLGATYAPGSTYKMSMVIAGIDSGAITSKDTIYDKGVFDKYNGFSANCLAWTNSHYSHGSIAASEALKVSCNYYFYELADKMKIEVIDAVAKGLGLGESTGVELSELVGTRANAITKANLFAGTEDAGWYPADQIMASIGQSFNAFTPMQLAVYTSTLCNQGTRYKATYLSRVVSADYKSLVMENKTQILSTMDISDEAYEAYSVGMQMAASELGGTAYSTFYNYPVKVAAKTGSAQIGGDWINGAFVCYAPADDPQIAVVVYGERAGGGGKLGAVARAVLDVYFNLTVSDTDNWENQVN